MGSTLRTVGGLNVDPVLRNGGGSTLAGRAGLPYRIVDAHAAWLDEVEAELGAS